MPRRKTSAGPVSTQSPEAAPAKRRGRQSSKNALSSNSSVVSLKERTRAPRKSAASKIVDSLTEALSPAEVKKAVRDWEAIEAQYRAGVLSLRAIAFQHGISQTAVHKKAKAEGWERNLADKVRVAAKEKLVREDGLQSGLHTPSLQSSVNDKQTIEVAAQAIVSVAREHRSTLKSGRSIVHSLLMELQEASDHREDIEAAIEEETTSDRDGKRRAMMLRAVALPSRAGIMLNLSAAMKNVIVLERQAFNMDDAPSVASGEVPEGAAVFKIEFVKSGFGSGQHPTAGGF